MKGRLGVARAALLSACALCWPVWAADYYVDSTAGADANSGLVESEPWETLSKVNTSSFEFGDTVFLKRGSRWSASITVPSSGLTIDAYGSGAPPTLDSSVPITGWTAASGLLGLFGSNGVYGSPAVALSPPDVSALGNLTENGVMMSLVKWAGSPSTLSNAASGTYTYDYGARKLYIKPASNPNGAGKSYRASTLLHGVKAVNKTDITVQNLNLTRFSLHGVQFTDCTRCTARNLTITDGGGAVVIPPNIYAGNGVEWNGTSSAGVAEGLTIRNVLDSGISPQTFKAGNRLSDISIRNCSIDRSGFAGVEISLLPGGGPAASVVDVSISDTTITNSGRGWSGNRYGNNANGIRIVADRDQGAMSGISVRRTTVSNSIGNGINIEGQAGTVTLERLRLNGNENGVRAFANTGQSPTLKLVMYASVIDVNRSNGVLYDAPSSAGFNLFHNSFYRNGPRNLHVRGQTGQAYLENNLFAGESDMAQLYVDNYVASSWALHGARVNNNCYSKTKGMFYYKRVSHSTLATFRTASGFEDAGVEAGKGFLGNPTGLQLVNPASGNFALNTGSVCIGSGSDETGVAMDYLGNAYKTPPSGGAVERYP